MTRQKVWSFFQLHWKGLLLLLFVLLLGILLWRIHTLEKELDNSKQEVSVTTMESRDAEDANSLENTLHINKQSAKEVQRGIIDAQHGLRRPESVYKTPRSEGDTSVKAVQKSIATAAPNVPKVALEKTDKTVVVEQKDNPEVSVGVYKINTYRNWELGTGIGHHDGDNYIPLSLQRNYAKNRSVMAEIHYDLDDRQVNGGELQWKVHF